ncbi:MAG: response regulator [Pseudomonadota bacterium]
MTIKILLVDDASFIRDLVKKQLRDHILGVEIFEAADGARALIVLKHNPIDMILSDWEMPLMTGEELLKQIRATTDYAKTPFIMISSRGDREHVTKAVQAGVSDYLNKPFSAEELLAKVKKQLKIIGKLPSHQTRQGGVLINNSSLDILTSGKKVKSDYLVTNSSSAAILMSSSAVAMPGVSKLPANNGAKAKAQLRFADNIIFVCVVREMTLQLMSCVMQRGENLPRLFDQAVVDIDMGEEKGIARVNGYVHSITAGESRPDSNIIKIVIRFVDNDIDKFAVLSKFIDQMH